MAYLPGVIRNNLDAKHRVMSTVAVTQKACDGAAADVDVSQY